MGEWFGLALWILIAAGLPPGVAFDDGGQRLWPRPWESAALFNPARRSVTNWRQESTRWLDVDLARRWRFLVGDGADLPRCVRLNNYWCVKRAGWAGEIAADAEDHVAFGSAREGAAVAALLLRRYYVDLGRVSALDIVSRWAPAQCGGAVAAKGGASGVRRATRRAAAGTLRGRWLARNRPGFTGPRYVNRKALPRSRVASAPPPMMRAPTIAAGGGELAPVALSSLKLSALDPGAPVPRGAKGRAPLASCAGERQRIDNYAAKLAAGLAARPTDDLHLFDGDGDPTPALATALLNMSAVEIGPFRPEPALIDDAVDDLREIVRLRREAAAKEAAGKAAREADKTQREAGETQRGADKTPRDAGKTQRDAGKSRRDAGETAAAAGKSAGGPDAAGRAAAHPAPNAPPAPPSPPGRPAP